MTQLTKNFGKVDVSRILPDLVNLQLDSYHRFLCRDSALVKPNEGLEAIFRSIFPIEDFNKTASLEYVSYSVGEPKFDQFECIVKGLTYEVPLRLRVRLVVYDVDSTTNIRKPKDIKEQDIYFGTIPLMTDKGTFIINGTERVVVNQLQRSPGVIFEHDYGKTHMSKKFLYSARIIPIRGSWIDFDFDSKDILYLRIDRRRKLYATVLLKAMGLMQHDILKTFFKFEHYTYAKRSGFQLKVEDGVYRKDLVALKDICDEAGNVLLQKDKRLDRRSWKKILDSDIKTIPVERRFLLGQFFAEDVLFPKTQEVVYPALTEITEEVLDALEEIGIKSFSLLHIEGSASTGVIETLRLDKIDSVEEAQLEIYRRLRPSSPTNAEIFSTYFDNIFRNPDYYDLSFVGRYKVNQRLGLSTPKDCYTLTDEDIITCLKTLFELKNTQGPSDDIDNLSNRRVRPVGELVEASYRTGLVRMERAIKERMSLQDVSSLMPHDLINPKPVVAVLKEFFGTSQLSQFMDQTNSLSEVTHKRRLSALGPGGLTRERAGFEVRDVHNSHYGRICPIETPEGPNIGLIVSLTTYARVNEYGFIETPYRLVDKAKLTDTIVYLDAFHEIGAVVAQAGVAVDKSNCIQDPMVRVRESGEIAVVPKEMVTHTDITPGQMVSVSAALIPFLEHDDANRALMGSNMQRQAVPLIACERPLVGTGMEEVIARDTHTCVVAEGPGVVRYVDANRIILAYDPPLYPETSGVKVYELQKYHKSNQNSCFGQKPTCTLGQRFEANEILADGPSIKDGELALGKNLTVAFMPWCGFNFEDSILISERCLKEDTFTSIHIEEFEVVARDTKLGPEEITQDIPNVSEDALRDIDSSGIIRIGAAVKPDSILVGKITPKGESQLTPEERLLRAIFGDKARDVRNTSLKVPPGVEGVVIDVKVFNRRSGEKDERTVEIEQEELDAFAEKERVHLRAMVETIQEEMLAALDGAPVEQVTDVKLAEKNGIVVGEPLSMEKVSGVPIKQIPLMFPSEKYQKLLLPLVEKYDVQQRFIRNYYATKQNHVTEGDDLPPGVIKMVKVYIAVKRKLSVGDKMAGRHGNKGVVSCILPVEDMPFFADGRSVDIVLNPLGVPSRMNIGQIMETHLGWAAKELGGQLAQMLSDGTAYKALREEVKSVFDTPAISEMVDAMTDEELCASVKQLHNGIITKTPVFDGAREEEVWSWLEKAKLPTSGKSVLYDGRTGEPFHHHVTTGIMYVLKLHHLVDEKIHARSTGPYSLITQQPLGGKAQFGGQRLGEMEVWALEAYGAAYLLQEFLTVKSDDVTGRVKMYEKIVKGDNFLEAGLPESFNVLVKELMSLGINVSLYYDDERKNTAKDVTQQFFEDQVNS